MLRRVGGYLIRRTYLAIRYNFLPRVGHELVKRRRPERLLSEWAMATEPGGLITLGSKVCVFVHWDGAGDVRPHVLNQVQSLAEAGLSVVFVTNAGKLLPGPMARLQTMCAAILIRGNVGYDFGAWREGLGRLALPRPDTAMVVIANDSVYGPVRSLASVLGRIDFGLADVWGCTDSWQHRYHLQSYFMAFSPAVLRSPVWSAFWADVRPTWSKGWLIRLYEVGLTQALLKAGFRCRAIWPYQALVRDIDAELLMDHKEGGPNLADPAIRARQVHARRLRAAVVERVALNPTSDLWRQLLSAGYPFIKRELLRDNPTRVPDVAEWRSVLADTGGCVRGALGPIELDLQRTLKNRAP